MNQALTLRTLTVGIALALAGVCSAVNAQDGLRDPLQNPDAEQIPGSLQTVDPSLATMDQNSSDLSQPNLDQIHGELQSQNAQSTLAEQSDAAPTNRQIQDRPGQTASDARREGVIWATFALTDELFGTDVSVEVDQGTATLTGRVPSRAELELAEDLAESVSGIGRVANQITIDPSVTSGRTAAVGQSSGERDFGTVITDASTTAAVKSRLLGSSDTGDLKIDVDTQFGHVTLKGTTDSDDLRQAAERLASAAPGVQRVTNELSVETNATVMATAEIDAKTGFESTTAPTATETTRTADDSLITATIRSTLDSSTVVDSNGIGISAKDGVVRLVGTVASDADKTATEQIVRGVVGVKDVDVSGLTAQNSSLAGSEDDE